MPRPRKKAAQAKLQRGSGGQEEMMALGVAAEDVIFVGEKRKRIKETGSGEDGLSEEEEDDLETDIAVSSADRKVKPVKKASATCSRTSRSAGYAREKGLREAAAGCAPLTYFFKPVEAKCALAPSPEPEPEPEPVVLLVPEPEPKCQSENNLEIQKDQEDSSAPNPIPEDLNFREAPVPNLLPEEQVLWEAAREWFDPLIDEEKEKERMMAYIQLLRS
ncbi:hypothetical protein M422DRAFT_260517 [Sphaerobolus stellatus SS14]|uniref:Uncharacterized protein n=1 Tax=Sphaerobolus stellatus (strain SS14) TaxID=990650 RepID=A0A0C9VII4_SPHS4|nr:hypothetical protein M422DRAFT_260517 [Sphaerobolus stellatus SS14]